MTNLAISARPIDGSLMPFVDEGQSCKEACESFTGDDTGAPVVRVVIEVKTKSGKMVVVNTPNSPSGIASVRIDEQEI
jgi:hypothetical protein